MSTQASSTACCILHRLSHHTHISSAFSSPQPQPPAPPHTCSPHAYLPPLVPRPLHGPPPSPSPLHSVRPCLRRVRWCLRVRVRVSKRPSIRMCSYCICVRICECARAPVPVCADRVYLFPPVQPARIFLPKPRSALRAPAKPSSSAHAAIPAAPCLAVSGCLAGVRQSAAGHPSVIRRSSVGHPSVGRANSDAPIPQPKSVCVCVCARARTRVLACVCRCGRCRGGCTRRWRRRWGRLAGWAGPPPRRSSPRHTHTHTHTTQDKTAHGCGAERGQLRCPGPRKPGGPAGRAQASLTDGSPAMDRSGALRGRTMKRPDT